MVIITSTSFKLRALELAISCLCIFSCVHHMANLIKIYLEYRTSTTIRMQMPEQFWRTSFHICIRFTDVLDYEQIRGDNSSRLWRPSPLRESRAHYQHELTIAEILKYTPDVGELMQSARYRVSHSYSMQNCERKKCLSLFKLKKFVHVDYICYTLVSVCPQGVQPMYHAITTTASSGGEVLRIYPSPAFNSSSVMRVFTHRGNELPYSSFASTPVKRRAYDTSTRTAKYNSLVASSKFLINEKMEPPYDTRCKKYSPSTRLESIETCVKDKVLTSLQKIPFSSMIAQPLDLKMISSIDVNNQTITDSLFRFRYECKILHPQPDCESSIHLTQTHAGLDDQLTILLMATAQPYTSIKTFAQIGFVEFLTLVMSTLSLWTGLSIITFNPVTLYFLFKDRFRLLQSSVTSASSERTQSRTRTPAASDERRSPDKMDILSERFTCLMLSVRRMENRLRHLELANGTRQTRVG